jgi:hypothetical protein
VKTGNYFGENRSNKTEKSFSNLRDCCVARFRDCAMLILKIMSRPTLRSNMRSTFWPTFEADFKFPAKTKQIPLFQD